MGDNFYPDNALNAITQYGQLKAQSFKPLQP